MVPSHLIAKLLEIGVEIIAEAFEGDVKQYCLVILSTVPEFNLRDDDSPEMPRYPNSIFDTVLLFLQHALKSDLFSKSCSYFFSVDINDELLNGAC